MSSAIDTGFIVHNPRTYPVLLRLFAELGVATQPSEMSMSIRDDDTGLQWAGALGRQGRLPDGRQPAQPALPADAHRDPAVPPPRSAPAAEASDGGRTSRCASSSTQGRFSAYFHRHFMEPLVAAVWSCDPEVALDYPARYLFTFLEHHGMLGVFGSPQWRTVTGGSQQYVAAVAARLQRGPHRRQGHLGPRDLRRRRGHRRQRRGAALRRRRHRDPPGPGARDARRADRRAARRARRDALLAQHRAAAHRHLGAAAARGTPGRRGTSPRRARREGRCWSPTT